MTVDNSWPTHSVIYQIYPRSFKDTDGNGIGDLAGIIEKIPYLVELGVDAVWLSPIYKSPQKDFGYDVSDHISIDPIFGTIEDFDTLVTKLHENGIKILMDIIPNHTSDKHAWFVESRKDKSNPKRDWYIWADPKSNGKPPNNWLSVFGGSAWELDHKTGQYYYHAFDYQQPDLNWKNPQVQEAVFDILRFWIDHEVDGFRIDAVNYLFENSELMDEPPNPNIEEVSTNPYDNLLHIHTLNQNESIEMLKKMADVIKSRGHKLMITESYTHRDELVKMYRTVDWHMYQPFNFSLINLPWLAAPHKEYIDEYEKALDNHYLPCYVTGNHDKSRVVSRLGARQARNAAILLLTLRGNTFIYYGEEIGMRDVKIPRDRELDPYNIYSPGLGLSRSPARTPMQWDDSPSAGFSTGELWLPVASNYEKANVVRERVVENSFLNLYKQLIKIKKTNQVVAEGDYIPLDSPAENVFAYIRERLGQRVLVIINFDGSSKKITMGLPSPKVILNSFLDRKFGEEIDLTDFTLRPDEGLVLSI